MAYFGRNWVVAKEGLGAFLDVQDGPLQADRIQHFLGRPAQTPVDVGQELRGDAEFRSVGDVGEGTLAGLEHLGNIG